jgi:hypothetical protein
VGTAVYRTWRFFTLGRGGAFEPSPGHEVVREKLHIVRYSQNGIHNSIRVVHPTAPGRYYTAFSELEQFTIRRIEKEINVILSAKSVVNDAHCRLFTVHVELIFEFTDPKRWTKSSDVCTQGLPGRMSTTLSYRGAGNQQNRKTRSSDGRKKNNLFLFSLARTRLFASLDKRSYRFLNIGGVRVSNYFFSSQHGLPVFDHRPSSHYFPIANERGF